MKPEKPVHMQAAPIVHLESIHEYMEETTLPNLLEGGLSDENSARLYEQQEKSQHSEKIRAALQAKRIRNNPHNIRAR